MASIVLNMGKAHNWPMEFNLLIICKKSQEAKELQLQLQKSAGEIFLVRGAEEAIPLIDSESIHTIICGDDSLDQALLALDKTQCLIPLIVLGQNLENAGEDYQKVVYLKSTRSENLINIVESFRKHF